MIIAPSILSADWSILKKEVEACTSQDVEYLHIDVMDGHFVPQLSFGPKLIKDIRIHTSLFFDVHLMVTHPCNYFASMIEAGADALTFHIEATHYSFRLISELRNLNKNIKIGIAVNPQTSIAQVIPVIHEIDMVLLMGVEPGYGGQSFIPSTLDKISELAHYRKSHALSYVLSVDGGVNINTAQKILHAGADILVVGSSYFTAEDKGALIYAIRNLK